MIQTDYSLVLWLVVAWPLVLAFPALHSHLPKVRLIAVLPALLLLFAPDDVSYNVSWLMLESGFALDGATRWILAMSVIVWIVAAINIKTKKDPFLQKSTTTFFMITLSGNLGVVLAADLVMFFVFAALMGYGFYALLLQTNEMAARRAARLYLLYLIIADLILFEALLLAANATAHLQFSSLNQALASGEVSPLYPWLVFIGFGLKTGIWPFHLWLVATYRYAIRPLAMMLGGVPVALAVLGMMQWMPFSEEMNISLGAVCLAVAIAACIHAMYVFMKKSQLLPLMALLIASSVLLSFIGISIMDPKIWVDYGYLGLAFVSLLGVLPLALTTVMVRSGKLAETNVDPDKHVTILPPRTERAIHQVVRWFNTIFIQCESLRDAFYNKMSLLQNDIRQRLLFLDAAESSIRCWHWAMTCLAILVFLVAFIAISL